MEEAHWISTARRDRRRAREGLDTLVLLRYVSIEQGSGRQIAETGMKKMERWHVGAGWGITRRTFLGSAGAAMLQAQRRRMNIVLILADDLGWADTAVYGADLHETPNIDRLAAEGMRFTNACAAAPICSPTRASIMAGKHPARLHMTIWYEGSKRVERGRKLIPPATVSDLPHAEVTLAELLQPAGLPERFRRQVASRRCGPLSGNAGIRCQHRRNVLGRAADLLLSLPRRPPLWRGEAVRSRFALRQARRIPDRPLDR